TRGDTKQSITQTYTMKMARERGLPNGKDVWAKFPENMLRFKAFNLVANFLVPDALHGIPIKEDIEDSESVEVTESKTSHADPKIAAFKTANKPSLAEVLKDKPEAETTPAPPETAETKEPETAPEVAPTAIEARK